MRLYRPLHVKHCETTQQMVEMNRNKTAPSPDVAVAEAKKKVFRLEKVLEVLGDSTGAGVDFLKKALAKAHEAAR